MAPALAAKQALDILREHDTGFGPAMAIAATRYAAALLGTGNPQEAQVGVGRMGRASAQLGLFRCAAWAELVHGRSCSAALLGTGNRKVCRWRHVRAPSSSVGCTAAAWGGCISIYDCRAACLLHRFESLPSSKRHAD